MLVSMLSVFGIGGNQEKISSLIMDWQSVSLCWPNCQAVLCSVERVFSKLERIRQHTGDNLKEDMCEVRLLLQCNGDLDDMYNVLL